MDQWGEFVFHEPYAGDKIERINNVVLPKQYLPSLDKGACIPLSNEGMLYEETQRWGR